VQIILAQVKPLQSLVAVTLQARRRQPTVFFHSFFFKLHEKVFSKTSSSGTILARFEKNPFFSKKNGFFVFFKARFCSFFKENGKKHSELFLLHHAISPFSELHNSNLLYLLSHSKLRVKKCTPSLFLQSVVGQFTPMW